MLLDRAGAVDQASERADAANAGGDHVPPAAACSQDSRVTGRAGGRALCLSAVCYLVVVVGGGGGAAPALVFVRGVGAGCCAAA